MDLYAAEGHDFAAELERRNPAFATATGAYGENTLELARGIERLELAVHEEETKRVMYKQSAPAQSAMLPIHQHFDPRKPSPDDAAPYDDNMIARGRACRGAQHAHQTVQPSDFMQFQPPQQALRARRSTDAGYSVLSSTVSSAAPSLSNMHSDETLCLMQSDIHALKLELMRLQRSKTIAGTGIIAPPPSSSDVPLTLSTL